MLFFWGLYIVLLPRHVVWPLFRGVRFCHRREALMNVLSDDGRTKDPRWPRWARVYVSIGAAFALMPPKARLWIILQNTGNLESKHRG